jgi:choline dehydrogenase-like flavoprotein
MKEIQANVVIVGSGAGGATIAKELTEHGKNVLILEKGEDPSLIKKAYIKYNDGILMKSIYKKFKMLIGINRNLHISWRTGIGGTTTVASANAVRSLEKELYSLGVNIRDEFQEIEQELKVTSFPQNRMGKGAKKIWDAANSLGLKFEPIPKFIDFTKCSGCNKCNVKCTTNAKWTSVNFINRAKDNGASLLQNVMVNEVLTSNGNAVGVKALSPWGEIYVRANIVVLAAGAIETPIILQKTGIESAGKKLFCDPCYYVYGPSKNDFFDAEARSIINSEFLHKDGFTLLNCSIQSRNIKYLPKFMKSEAKEGMLGVMIKIKDDPIGYVHSYGGITKHMTFNDLCKLNAGVEIAKEILIKAGVDHRYIKIKGVGGFHPGCTAAIGEVVDQNQETEVKNLFVSDASVMPTSPGLPPMLTIIALSKRLSKRLTTMM